MLAAEEMAGRDWSCSPGCKTAHYVEGRRIAERAVLVGRCNGTRSRSRDLCGNAGASVWLSAVQAHIDETRKFMAEVGAQGFPTFVLETPEGLQIVDFAACLGRPQAFRVGCAVGQGLPTSSGPKPKR